MANAAHLHLTSPHLPYQPMGAFRLFMFMRFFWRGFLLDLGLNLSLYVSISPMCYGHGNSFRLSGFWVLF